MREEGQEANLIAQTFAPLRIIPSAVPFFSRTLNDGTRNFVQTARTNLFLLVEASNSGLLSYRLQLNFDFSRAYPNEVPQLTSELITQRLQLSPVRAADWEEYFPILAAPETSEHTDLPRNPSEKRTQGLVNWMVRVSEQSKGFGWMIREQETGTLAGCIRLNSIDWKASVAVVGYEFGRSFWGKGLATEALTAITGHCFRELKLFRLESWTVAGNPASDRVLEKVGFRLEGVQRQKMIIRGQRIDKRLFALLRTD